MTRHYTHTSEAAATTAVAALPDITSKTPNIMLRPRERFAHTEYSLGYHGSLIADIEMLPPPTFADKVKRTLDAGMAGEGRGFVLMPSASPYGRDISALCLKD